MGVQLSELLERRPVSLSDLKGRIVAVDAFNTLYQFLTSIRQMDGSPLTDSHGNVTSHLVGLFSRTTALLEQGIKPAFVFDGVAPAIKKAERERRKAIKVEAAKLYETAVAQENVAGMKKYASRTSRLTSEMIAEARELVAALGLPVISAPSEGEAEAAYLVKTGSAFALVSQDADGLLFGAPRLVRNLSVSGRRKIAGRAGMFPVQPEIVNLSENLMRLGLDQEQLIALGMLIGTDYNVGGIKGIGPQKGLALVKKHGRDFGALFHEVKWDEHFPLPWQEVYDTFVKMPMRDEKLIFGQANEATLQRILVDNHDFSSERVASGLASIRQTKSQQGLGAWM